MWYDNLFGNEKISLINLLAKPINRDFHSLFSLFFRIFREWKSKKIFIKRDWIFKKNSHLCGAKVFF